MTKTSYMIWIPGRVIWTGTDSKQALSEFSDYVLENEQNLDVVRLTVYEHSNVTGKRPEFHITGREAQELLENADS